MPSGASEPRTDRGTGREVGLRRAVAYGRHVGVPDGHRTDPHPRPLQFLGHGMGEDPAEGPAHEMAAALADERAQVGGVGGHHRLRRRPGRARTGVGVPVEHAVDGLRGGQRGHEGAIGQHVTALDWRNGFRERIYVCCGRVPDHETLAGFVGGLDARLGIRYS
ncbi:hypothetical protein GCM10009560_46350 [Nonomuraea longicatena]|uniref:Uncharacterized protein n=1 Tax=Nonomuraea longicatena TaxID=83682 RepID=A0ABN1Q531_9ACTN